jgi:hypothetical protein
MGIGDNDIYLYILCEFKEKTTVFFLLHGGQMERILYQILLYENAFNAYNVDWFLLIACPGRL